MAGKKLKEFLNKRDTIPFEYYADSEFDGISPLDDPKDRLDLKNEENYVFQKWRTSAEKLSICSVGKLLEAGETPDFWAFVNETKSSVELTRMIDGNFRAAQKRAHSQGRLLNPYSAEGFHRTQWNKEKFSEHLGNRIGEKSARYAKPTSSIVVLDYLVIYSSEIWLTANQVGQWLSKTKFPRPDNINNVHFMLDYDPSLKMWPLFVVH